MDNAVKQQISVSAAHEIICAVKKKTDTKLGEENYWED